MFISLLATVGDAGAPAVLRAALRRLQAPTDPAERGDGRATSQLLPESHLLPLLTHRLLYRSVVKICEKE